MQHFAELDANNCVLRVIVIADSDCMDENGNISETIGSAFCNKITDSIPTTRTSTWVITYPSEDHTPREPSSSARKNFAGIGDYFDSERNAFIAPKSYDNWVFDEERCAWIPPVPKPNDGIFYAWDQENNEWVLV